MNGNARFVQIEWQTAFVGKKKALAAHHSIES